MAIVVLDGVVVEDTVVTGLLRDVVIIEGVLDKDEVEEEEEEP